MVSSAFRDLEITKDMNEFTTPALKAIKAMVDETNQINDTISNLDAIDINARLQDLAGRLGIDSEQFIIRHKDFQVVINLNVTMETGNVADAIITTKKVMATGE